MKVTDLSLESLRQNLAEESACNKSFLILTVSSCVIATLGLLMNSSAVIIGAMIIAPLMLPLRGLALAALEADMELLRESLLSLGLGTLAAICISGLIGGIFGLPYESFGSEILARTSPNLADLGVALTAGAVSGYAKIRPRISDALAGTAIAVALMPPLCTVGIALAQRAWLYAGGAFLLYFTNFLGITLACILIFVWAGYYRNPRRMRRGLLLFLVMNMLLGIPLLIGLINLISQARIQRLIQQLLSQRTVTFGQQVEVVNLRVDWNNIPWSSSPSRIALSVRSVAGQPIITPKQVKLVEDFLEQELNRRFRITVRVSEFVQVESSSLEP